MGKVIAAIFTAILAPLLVWWITNRPPPPPQVPAELVGDWMYDRTDKGNTNVGGMNFKIDSVRFFDDATYVVTATVSFPSTGTTFPSNGSGRFSVNGKSIRFEQSNSTTPAGQNVQSPFSVMDYSIAGAELKLADPNYVLVFKRIKR